MSAADAQALAIGALQGLASSTVFVLVLFIGFCVVVGFTKLKKTAGTGTMVIKSLDETISHQPMLYLRRLRRAVPQTSSIRRNSWKWPRGRVASSHFLTS